MKRKVPEVTGPIHLISPLTFVDEELFIIIQVMAEYKNRIELDEESCTNYSILPLATTLIINSPLLGDVLCLDRG